MRVCMCEESQRKLIKKIPAVPFFCDMIGALVDLAVNMLDYECYMLHVSLEQERPNQSLQDPAGLGCTQLQWRSVQNQTALNESVCVEKRGQQLSFSAAEEFKCGNTKLLFRSFPP